MKINIQGDCNNSPKKSLIRDLTIFFSSYDLEKAISYMDDNISWTLVGEKPIIGKDLFRDELQKMSDNKVIELSIFSIISHGKEAAINGEMTMKNGHTFGFADFYEFTSAKGTKVKSIVSYVILKNKQHKAGKL